MISPLFTTIVLFATFVFIYMKITSKEVNSFSSALLEKEQRANSVRRQPLDSLPYIKFGPDSIPFVNPAPNERIEELEATLHSLTVSTIVNLTGISNTDLKLTYGPANLPALSEYDLNFTTLAKTLYAYGVELLNAGYKSEATSVLTYAVSIGTDISANYICLANIYVENQEYDKINDLIAAANSINSLTKQSTISKLIEILDSHTTMVISHNSNKAQNLEDAKALIPEEILELLD